jgi:hypothetical protein
VVDSDAKLEAVFGKAALAPRFRACGGAPAKAPGRAPAERPPAAPKSPGK